VLCPVNVENDDALVKPNRNEVDLVDMTAFSDFVIVKWKASKSLTGGLSKIIGLAQILRKNVVVENCVKKQ
jgi:hypothetical protein